ncbi:MAG: Bug family tripartite tricarboxylate transporter substrate binding protein [Vicinamibacteria bacterium]|jgi:tripartite-type tricarboxylate transporter receptor subunit TctC
MKRLLVACALALAGLAPAAAAQDTAPYPNRPIRLVVPNAAGSGDIVPRLLASKLAASLGQPVVIENRPGASFNIASDFVAKQPADGYTLLYSTSVITLLPQVIGPVAVDPVASFVPIVKLLTIPVIIVVNPALGVRTLDELVALARQKPGRIAYATTGLGSLPHLVATMLSGRAGIELLHTPYTNIGQAAADVLNGTIPVYVTFYSQVQAHLQSGAMVPIAVASTTRTHVLPDVPTVVELGYPEATVEPWAGMFAPAGTRPEIVERLNREFNAILASPDVRERFAQLGMEAHGSTPERFASDIRAQVARWPAIVKAAGLKRD